MNREHRLIPEARFASHRDLLFASSLSVALIGRAEPAVRPGWADLALETGRPQCAHLGRMIRRERHASVDSSLRIYLCRLGGGWRLRRRYLKAFASARRRIHVAHGYLLPDRGVVRAIITAARRGVQVSLLLAGRSDVPFARAATSSLHRRCSRRASPSTSGAGRSCTPRWLPSTHTAFS